MVQEFSLDHHRSLHVNILHNHSMIIKTKKLIDWYNTINCKFYYCFPINVLFLFFFNVLFLVQYLIQNTLCLVVMSFYFPITCEEIPFIAALMKGTVSPLYHFSSVSRVQLFVTRWTACSTPVSITTSWSLLLKLMSIESVMPSNHLILCHPLFFLPSIFPSIRSFPVSQFFTSSGQSIGVSASILPMNIQV